MKTSYLNEEVRCTELSLSIPLFIPGETFQNCLKTENKASAY